LKAAVQGGTLLLVTQLEADEFVKTGGLSPVLMKLRIAGFENVEASAGVPYRGQPVVEVRCRWNGQPLSYSMVCGVFEADGSDMPAAHVLKVAMEAANMAIQNRFRMGGPSTGRPN
jgi:hypothetical protein